MPKTNKALVELLKQNGIGCTGDSSTDIEAGYLHWPRPFELVTAIFEIEVMLGTRKEKSPLNWSEQ